MLSPTYSRTSRGALVAVVLLAFAPDVCAAVTCSVAKVELPDTFAGQQLLVSDNGRDVTHDATYASTNPAVATVDAKGYVTPTGDGSAVVRITRGADKLEVPVTVKASARRVAGWTSAPR